jgi:hypothetical protein
VNGGWRSPVAIQARSEERVAREKTAAPPRLHGVRTGRRGAKQTGVQRALGALQRRGVALEL